MSIHYPSRLRGRGTRCVWWWEVLALTFNRSRLMFTDGRSVDEFYEYNLPKPGVDQLLTVLSPDDHVPGGWLRARYDDVVYRGGDLIIPFRLPCLTVYECDDYIVDCDGDTLWINGAQMLGRFSPRGSDVHVDGYCCPDTCTPNAYWPHFAEKMAEHHGIDVEPFKEHLTWMRPATSRAADES